MYKHCEDPNVNGIVDGEKPSAVIPTGRTHLHASRMHQAMRSVMSGRMSVNAAAKFYKLSRSTLQRRVSASKSQRKKLMEFQFASREKKKFMQAHGLQDNRGMQPEDMELWMAGFYMTDEELKIPTTGEVVVEEWIGQLNEFGQIDEGPSTREPEDEDDVVKEEEEPKEEEEAREEEEDEGSEVKEEEEPVAASSVPPHMLTPERNPLPENILEDANDDEDEEVDVVLEMPSDMPLLEPSVVRGTAYISTIPFCDDDTD